MVERTRAGLAAAAARGKRGGRIKLLDEKEFAELKQLRAQGFTVSRLAETFRVTESSVYRYLNAQHVGRTTCTTLWVWMSARRCAEALTFRVILRLVVDEGGEMSYNEHAETVLEPMRAQNSGVLSLPVDPVAMARHFGINVYSSDLPNNVSGILSKLDANEGVDMFLNRNHAPVRQRFTAAHELGHYFRNVFGPQLESYYFERADLARCGTDQDEIYANGFAACLLMPRQEVEALRSAGYGIVQLTNAFHVSTEAMSNRLKNL